MPSQYSRFPDLNGAGITVLTGDATATGPGSAVTTLATVNSNTGSFGTSSSAIQFIVNSKGLITSASNTPIQITESQVTNLVSDLANKQVSGNYITALTGDVGATGPGSVSATINSIQGNTINGVTGTGNIVFSDSAVLTGIPTAPTASVGTSTTQLATTAFVLSQGFTGASGSMPSAHQSSTTVVTSATTTYVTAISTTITVTTTGTPVYAAATATLTTTTALTVAKCRISINGVAGQEQLVTLTALTTNYPASVQYRSANLTPGTYNVIFEIARNSGTGTVSFFEGSIDAIALQGASSNGITQLTGDVTAGPGSGSVVATIPAASITGAKIASATITSANIAATTILNANISTVDAAKITTGTLPIARGGTGATSFPNTRVPVSNGTNFVSDSSFLYDPTLHRLSVGSPGSAAITGTVLSGSDLALQGYSRGTNNCIQAQNENSWSLSLVNAGNVNGAAINGEFSRGTLVARTQSKSGDVALTINSQGYTGSGFATGFSSKITVVLSEDTTATNQGGEIVLSPTPNGTTAPVESLRLKNSGEAVFAKAIATAQFSTVNKLALTPSAGWVVYDTDLNKLSYYNGSTWINL